MSSRDLRARSARWRPGFTTPWPGRDDWAPSVPVPVSWCQGVRPALLPSTFALAPATALIMLAGIYYGSMYGGSTTSIVVNVPGEAASVVTAIDGYQMAKRGRAGASLSVSAVGSFVSGSLGVVGIVLLAKWLAEQALRFGPPEYFALTVVGLAILSRLSGSSLLMLLILNLPLVGVFVSILRLPQYVLSTLVLLLCLVGAFSLNNSPLDLWVLVGMGVVGYVFRKLSVDPAPLIVAVVLGPPLLAAIGRRRAARA
ncbi:MAG: tripartite tricarboxylate transporter permease [Candidatus Rokubacteria bacterium]|nr:tripartite tricarboxylate transporter permease [Candidatus Rokubacteria bacterium]